MASVVVRYFVGTAWNGRNCTNQDSAYKIKENAINRAKSLGGNYKVFDAQKNGAQIYPELVQKFYRVGTDWVNGKCVNQQTACLILENAVHTCIDLGDKYSVYDWKGNKVYPETPSKTISYYIGTDWVNGKCANQQAAYINKDYAIDHTKQLGLPYKLFDKNGNIIYTPAEDAPEWKKVYNVLVKEVGYLEKRSNANLYDKTANAGYNNYTKYWKDLTKYGLLRYFGYDKDDDFAGGVNWPWCAGIEQWGFIKALGLERGIELLLATKRAAFINCEDLYQKAKEKGLISKTPQHGAIVLFRNSKTGEHYHTEFCYRVKGNQMNTIGGNTSPNNGDSVPVANGGGVYDKVYNIDTVVADYFLPEYK